MPARLVQFDNWFDRCSHTATLTPKLCSDSQTHWHRRPTAQVAPKVQPGGFTSGFLPASRLPGAAGMDARGR